MSDRTQKIADQVVKKRRTRPDRSEAMSVHADKGDNARYLAHSLEIASLPAIDIKDPAQVEKRITEYFQICMKNDMKPGTVGLALALGVDRRTLNNWNTESHNDPRLPAIKKAKTMLETMMEDWMQNGKINPVAGIFLTKNNFVNYTDHSEVTVTTNKPAAIPETMGDVIDVYADPQLPETAEGQKGGDTDSVQDEGQQEGK